MFLRLYLDLCEYYYQCMQSLKMTQLTSEQTEQLSHNSCKQQMQQSGENYPYSMPTQIIILFMVLSTLAAFIGIVIFLYCKLFWQLPNQCKTSLGVQVHKKETETMLSSPSKQSVASSKWLQRRYKKHFNYWEWISPISE